MDEKKREEIKKEAKEILAKFSKAIGKVKLAKKDLKAEVGGFREEATSFLRKKPSRSSKNYNRCDGDFRKRIFDNAPETDDDCIIAEKKKW